MPRKPVSAIAVQPSQGKKLTFDSDESDDELRLSTPPPEARASSSSLVLQPREDSEIDDNEEEDDDDNDAPEAVGLSTGRKVEEEELSKQKSFDNAKKAKLEERSKKIAALRTKQAAEGEARVKALKDRRKDKGKGKGKGKEVEVEKRKVSPSLVPSEDESVEEGQDDGDSDDDEDTRRLKARMARAMDDGSGDSAEEDDGGGEEDRQSFHTESGSEDEDGPASEDEAEGDSDDSETLKDGPVDEATRKMRAKMQAMMEAAERRAAGLSNPVEEEDEEDPPKGPTGAAAEDEGMWDLSSGVQPLSASVLAAAAEDEAEEKEKKRAKAEARAVNDVVEGRKRKRSDKRRVITAARKRKIEGGKTVHLLPPTLDYTASTGGLPPVFEAGQKARGITGRPNGTDSRKKFMRKAMKFSGQVPGMGLVAGRRSIGKIGAPKK